MENPDGELELERNEQGLIVKASYKVYNPGEGDKRALEFCDLSSTLLKAEGPGDTNVNIDANVHIGG